MSKEPLFLPNAVALPLPDEVLEELVEKTKDWALMHGVAMRSKQNFNPDVLQFAPFCVFPSAIPRKEFNKVVELQLAFNELIHKIAHNEVFLTNCLRGVIEVDDFTANLFKIYQTICQEGAAQRIALGLLRCDYMLHEHSLKQVEMNTIASSFAGISTAITQLDRFVLTEIGRFDIMEHIPANGALAGLCNGMLDAWKMYNSKDSVILFIVEDVTYNICDQRFHEFEIRRLNPHVKVIRRTLTQMAERASLSKDKELMIDGMVVAVIYFRSGYQTDAYPSQKEWDARLLMERSKAIKCPSIQYHLAGTKKVQQELCKPGVLELFFDDMKKLEAIRELFVGIYGLEFDEAGNQAVQMAIANPERYVLKPQREGGGNNVYGFEIKDTMLQMKDSKERTAWILMEKICPPFTRGYVVRPGGPKIPPLSNLVSELGIFGVIIGDSDHIMVNKQVGHMLRTKDATADEGGVASGAGTLDGPFLVD
nr:unnamed protein product [Callosobruchus chinensis]